MTWIVLTYLLALCLAGTCRPRSSKRYTVLHDPISALLSLVLPAVADIAPEAAIGAGALGEGAALTLPEVSVLAAAPELAAGGALEGVAGLGALGLGAADVAGLGPGASFSLAAPEGDTGFANIVGPGGPVTGAEIPQGVVGTVQSGPFQGAAVFDNNGVQVIGDNPGMPGAITVNGQSLPPMTSQQLASALADFHINPASADISISPFQTAATDSGIAAQIAAQEATPALAPGAAQVALPPVDVGAEAAAPAGSPGFLSSLFNTLNPIGSAQAAEQPMVNIPGLGRVPAINTPTLASPDGTAAATTGTGTGTAAGSSAIAPAGGNTLSVGGMGLSPLAPGTPPPELAATDTGLSGGTPLPDTSLATAGSLAGTAMPPPATPPVQTATGPVATSSTAPAAPAAASPAAPSATPTPTGQVADTQDEFGGGSDAKSSLLEKAFGSTGKDINSFFKDNSGLFTALGLGLPLLTSLFNKPALPTLSSAQQAGTGALNNANANQAAPAQAFGTASTLGIPAAVGGINAATTAASPIIAGQTNLSNQAAAAAQPLLSAATTGVMPPGETDAIASALQASRGVTEGRYGSLGLSGSTSEAEDVASGAGAILAQVPGILNQLVSTGLNEVTASGSAGTTALSGLNSILNSVAGLQNAIQTEVGAAGGVTSGSNAVTSAAGTAANTDINIAQLQLQMDQELQTALNGLARNLALSNISPSSRTTVNLGTV